MYETYDNEILGLVEPKRIASAINPRLGIVGGGQLAKMTAMASLQLGCDVVVLERNNYSPAANLASHSIVGDWNNPEALIKLASQVDVVTPENEFVDAASLRAMEEGGFTLYPTAACIGLVQDKLVQKRTLAGQGLPVPRFEPVTSAAEVEQAARRLGWPLMLKARRNAYDGKGNATVRSAQEIPAAWTKLGGDAGRELFVEEFCDFVVELATIVTRGRDGKMAIYPVVETVQRNHICHLVKAPAAVGEHTAQQVVGIASRAVASVGGVGSFGVEMFLTRAGQILVNELAPRVHNSGHYTIEACICSQFENHVRAVLGWPLGSTAMVAPAAVMVNLLGERRSPGRPAGLERALAVPGAHVHIYGKAMSGAGRKMGHVTALGNSMDQALAAAQAAAGLIRFGETMP